MAAVSLIQLYAQHHSPLGPIQLQIEAGEYLALLELSDNLTEPLGTTREHLSPEASAHQSDAQALLQCMQGQVVQQTSWAGAGIGRILHGAAPWVLALITASPTPAVVS